MPHQARTLLFALTSASAAASPVVTGRVHIYICIFVLGDRYRSSRRRPWATQDTRHMRTSTSPMLFHSKSSRVDFRQCQLYPRAIGPTLRRHQRPLRLPKCRYLTAVDVPSSISAVPCHDGRETVHLASVPWATPPRAFPLSPSLFRAFLSARMQCSHARAVQTSPSRAASS